MTCSVCYLASVFSRNRFVFLPKRLGRIKETERTKKRKKALKQMGTSRSSKVVFFQNYCSNCILGWGVSICITKLS
jgi:hypothetical protein